MLKTPISDNRLKTLIEYPDPPTRTVLTRPNSITDIRRKRSFNQSIRLGQH